ncbi:uncharacterized protein LOC105444013 [Strongylocentrotus purpuratus]|uniref:Uncharacterized protein n=1 Tax=Strongylocentrotus purpuratus TaxID=7668 RepID=A0A7M7NA41_STRPU|nr:uncharacterized protein LOC105444013 [Strongylocentrotus purpuratus]|eukprot:XP_011676058.1 PREDICTED: uncharacterized protein LOC105444013 [Strongylocentrotus purpuratus]
MGKKRISDQKLIDIATDIGNGDHVMKLAIKLGVSAADAKNANLDCNTILQKAMGATAIKDQKDKLRDGLIKSGQRATADKHLPSRTPGRKAESNTELTPKQRKREVDDKTPNKSPTAKKPKGLSKLQEAEQKWEKAKKDVKEEDTKVKVLQKNLQDALKRLDHKNKEERKRSSVVTNLKRQEYDEVAKQQAKRKQELDKLESFEGTS